MKKIKLYNCFNHWNDKDCIWVLGDTHFNDSDCKLMDPNWPTPDEQVKLINSKVGKNDVLIILGDVGDVEYVKKLKGYKVLVMGNHDKGASNYRKTIHIHSWGFESTDDHLFDEVYEGPVFINEKILLSHEPVVLPFGVTVHGHAHSGKHMTHSADNMSYQINVASNIIGYTPIRLDKLIEGLKPNDIHRVAIEKAKEGKLNG